VRAFVLGILALVVIAAAAPDEVAATVADRGFFVEQGAAASPSIVSDAVAKARFDGGDLHVAVLAEEPPGGATTFADAVLNRLGAGTVLVVAPDSVGWASQGDIYTRAELDRALDAALEGGTDDEVVTRFVDALRAAGGAGASSPSSGSGSGVLVLLLIVGGLVLVVGLVVWNGSRRSRHAAAAVLADGRQKVQERLAAVANDIVDLDGEIALSDDEAAREHYERASATYTEVNEALPAASTPQALLELSAKLDEAIWELDAADAILDGEPVPPKPEPPKPHLTASSSEAPTATGAAPAGYRRSTRRSGYGTWDLLDMLAAAGMMTAGRRGMRLPGGLGGSGMGLPGTFGGGGPAGRMRGGGSRRMRGGGRRR